MILDKNIHRAMLIIYSILISINLYGRARNGNEGKGGIVIAGKSGMSMLVTEVYRDFSGATREFNSMPGPYTGLEVSRFFTPSLEAGAGISGTFLNGRTDAPDFSAIGYQYFMKEPLEGPVQYTNRLVGPELFARYRFELNKRSASPVGIFLKAGVGILFNESEIYYTNRPGDEIIFGKGYGKHKTTKLINGVYILGSGLSYALSDRIGLNLAASFNIVGYDFLDVVHNYDSAGNRREVVGLYTDITAGIAIKLERQKKTTSSGRDKLYARSPHLPFSP